MRFIKKRLIRGRLRPKLYILLFYEHNLETIASEEVKIAISIKMLEDIKSFEVNNINTFSNKRLTKRISNGDKCFITQQSGRLVSYHWLQTSGLHSVQISGEKVNIVKGEAVIYDVLVNKEFRGNRINGFVYSEMLKYCKQNEINRVWIYTEKRNIPNRKGLEKGGFSLYRQAYSFKFNNRFYFLKSKRINAI